MPLTLACTLATNLSIQGDLLRPDALRERSTHEVARLAIGIGNSSVELGELFHLDGDPTDGHLIIEGDLANMHGLGRGMSGGRLEIRGDVGHRVGAEMTGGTIEVHGSTGDRAGVAMRGGLLRIRGSAGDLVGSAYPGDRTGMRDGMILVDGSVGQDTGLAMRRGTIAIAGSSGDGLGRDLVAGSIFAFGHVGRYVGAGMKRGTIALFGDQEPQLLPTFRYACRIRPPFLTIYLRELRAVGFPTPQASYFRVFDRYNGDLLEGGHGEVMIPNGI